MLCVRYGRGKVEKGRGGTISPSPEKKSKKIKLSLTTAKKLRIIDDVKSNPHSQTRLPHFCEFVKRKIKKTKNFFTKEILQRNEQGNTMEQADQSGKTAGHFAAIQTRICKPESIS